MLAAHYTPMFCTLYTQRRCEVVWCAWGHSRVVAGLLPHAKIAMHCSCVPDSLIQHPLINHPITVLCAHILTPAAVTTHQLLDTHDSRLVTQGRRGAARAPCAQRVLGRSGFIPGHGLPGVLYRRPSYHHCAGARRPSHDHCAAPMLLMLERCKTRCKATKQASKRRHCNRSVFNAYLYA